MALSHQKGYHTMDAVTREQHRKITSDLEVAIAVVFEMHGLTLNVRGGSYGPSYTLKIEGLPEGAQAPEQAAWTRYAASYGLPVDGLGKSFTHAGDTFTVTGLNTRARRLPVLAISPDGQTYKFTAKYVADRIV